MLEEVKESSYVMLCSMIRTTTQQQWQQPIKLGVVRYEDLDLELDNCICTSFARIMLQCAACCVYSVIRGRLIRSIIRSSLVHLTQLYLLSGTPILYP
jgi:hypothetical protein